MNSKLHLALIAALGIGALTGCSQSTDTANAQAAALMNPAPAAEAPAGADTWTVAPAPTPEAEPAAAPAPAPIAAAAPVPAPAAAPRSTLQPVPEFARVVEVKDAMETVSEPREVCHDEEVVKQAPVKDEHRVAGTVAGAVVGGVIGNQIGDGKGRKIAKVVGIVGGAVAGNKIQQKMQEADTVTEIEKRCETVTETREQHVGYDVTYRYAGRTETVRMKEKPGATLPVKNGEVVIG